MTANLVLEILIKVSLLLLVALALDRALRRKWILAGAAMWNLALVSIVVLPLATIYLPAFGLPVLPPAPEGAVTPPDTVGRSPFGEEPSPHLIGVDHQGLAQSSLHVEGTNEDASRGDIVSAAAVDGAEISRGNILWAVAASIYGLGFAACLVNLALSWRGACQLQRHATPVLDPTWLSRHALWRGRLGLVDDPTPWRRRFLAARLGPPVRLLQSDQV